MTPTIPCAATRLILGAACALLPLAHAAAAPAECNYKAIVKLPLQYSGPSLEITTQGSINGRPARMLVATGFDETVLTLTGTEGRGLKLEKTGRRAWGPGGALPTLSTLVDEFDVGPVLTGPIEMQVLNTNNVIPLHYKPFHDAILGTLFLLQADLEISLANKELTFFAPENCGNTHLGYWGKEVRNIPFEWRDRNHRNPLFAVYINGKKMRAAINTGASVSFINSKAARRAGIVFDTPGTSKEVVSGIGSGTVGLWPVTLKTFQIGDDIVQDAEFTVLDSGLDDEEVTLGADFLRAHRVLFAMSQKKLYFSYVGGERFSALRKLEPWIDAEADSGNAYAQLYAGQRMVRRRDYAAAVPRLRAALDQLPDEHDGALLLYIARVKTGQAELAKTELAATFARTEGNEWPKPIADFFLGKLPADRLLAQAADDRNIGKQRRCAALSSMGDWHRAHGQPEQAKALDEDLKARCRDTGQIFISIGD